MHTSPLLLGSLASAFTSTVLADCPNYLDYSTQMHEPLSEGKYQLSYQRPDKECRKYTLPEAEDVVKNMKSVIKDPDLARLFENAYPNTLDTTISWKGFANNGTDEELTFITTGDIIAMWLRDSSNQLRSYKQLLTADDSKDSLASLYRGAINMQARFILESPYCNAFQAPPESGLPRETNDAAKDDTVKPTYSEDFVFECKYELDSISAFLQLSSDYYEKTQDADFFGKYSWVDAITTILDVAKGLQIGTYAENGQVNELPYTFQRTSNLATETLDNEGDGNPVKSGTGLVRSAFRPSDDATIYQLFIPANMQFSAYLGKCAEIMKAHDNDKATRMSDMSSEVRQAIEKHGKVQHVAMGEIYAFEVDGFGSANVMDDANVPSLLSAPIIDYIDADDETYQNTRNFVLSRWNPYYNWGPVFQGVGGPHQGPGQAWPMSIITSLLSSTDEQEIQSGIKSILSTTDGLGLIHETVNTFNQSDWTRQWFSWANGFFGELVLKVNNTHPHLLAISYQDDE